MNLLYKLSDENKKKYYKDILEDENFNSSDLSIYGLNDLLSSLFDSFSQNDEQLIRNNLNAFHNYCYYFLNNQNNKIPIDGTLQQKITCFINQSPTYNGVLFLRSMFFLILIFQKDLAELIIQNSDFINFLDNNLLIMNNFDILSYGLKFSSFLAIFFTELDCLFQNCFPNFLQHIANIIDNTLHRHNDQELYFTINKTLMFELKNIIDSVKHGKYYIILINFLITVFNTSFPPLILFDTLTLFINKYPIIAIQVITEDTKFLFYDLFEKYLFPKGLNPKLFYSFSQSSIKFLLQVLKVSKHKTGDLYNNIIDSLPIDDLIEYSFSIGGKIDKKCFPFHLLLLALKKPEKSWIFSMILDQENSEKLSFLFIQGSFNLKYYLIKILYLAINFQFNDKEMVYSFLNPEFVNTVIDFSISDYFQLSKQCLLFLDLLFTKATYIKIPQLVSLLINDYSINTLESLINSENQEIAHLAHQLINKLVEYRETILEI